MHTDRTATKMQADVPAAAAAAAVLQYPEVLGSILGALKAVVNVVGMTRMQPPIKELLPRLTPILKNRHEKVRGTDFGAGWCCCCVDCACLLLCKCGCCVVLT